MTSRKSSGSIRADSAVDPTKSENTTVTEVLRSEVFKLEEVTDELLSTLRNDHAVRLCNTLQARRKVRCLATVTEVLRSEVFKLEEVTDGLLSTLRNDHAVRLCNTLQARRKVRCLADDCLLLRSA
jgi:surfactin synthase thioesterase subunit